MIGDRRHLVAPGVRRAVHYPESAATSEVLAESLRADYSYAQHAAVHVGGWLGPVPFHYETITGGTGGTTFTVLACDTVVPQHWDEIRATCWFALLPIIVPGTDDFTLRITLDGETGDGTLSAEVEPLAYFRGLPAHRIDTRLSLSSVSRDSELSLTVELAKTTGALVAPLNCTAWAEVG